MCSFCLFETPIVPENRSIPFHFSLMMFLSFCFLALCSSILSVAEGITFNDCTSEEQAITWLRDQIEANQKIDKNIISIVYRSYGCEC